ncbi:MAG: hypothetical protein NC124_06970 [Clostridium sp.]|nr:hypothetical protein [Clostridium sp.]
MTKIKYDKRDKRLCGRAAAVFSVLAVLDGCMLYFGEGIMWHFPVAVEVMFVCAFYPFLLLAVGLWVGFMDAVLYLKRLQNYGYEVPEDKRQFGRDLEKLPVTEHAVKTFSGKNAGSIALTVLTGVITIGLIIYDVYFWYRYSALGEDIRFFEGMLVFGTVIWLIQGIFYARQISNRKYKYDVEIDHSWKNRRNLIGGLAEIIVLLAFTLLATELIHNTVQYMLKARAGR